MESGRLDSPQFLNLVTQGVAGLLLCVWLALPVVAQDVERYETVQNRARPELDALGLPLGAFTLYPAADLEYRSVDNIFADDRNEVDDSIIAFHPQVRLQSGWSRHSLRLGAELMAARYSDFGNEDYEDFSLWGDGRIDLRNGRIALAARHADLHEDRSSPDDEQSIEPNEFSTDGFELSYRYEPGASFAEVGIAAAVIDFDNAVSMQGIVNNDDRDRDNLDLKVRVGRRISDAYSGFVEVRASQIEYDQEFDSDGFQRSSDAYQLLAGTTIDLSGQLFGEIYVGYRDRDYDDPRFQNADGVALGADVTWNLSSLTTLNVSGSREVDSTTVVGASGIELTRLGISIDHELLRNLVISAAAAGATENFEGRDRDDDIQRFSVQARYMMNRYLHLTAGFEHNKRDTSPVDSGGREYTINSFFIQIRGQL